MTNQEIIDVWGWENLDQWNPTALADVAISDSAKTFLTEVGLPAELWLSVRFKLPYGSSERLPNMPHLFVIGQVIGLYPICIDEKSGYVIQVDDPKNTIHFINSNVELLGQCLAHYRKYVITIEDMSDEEAERVVVATEETLRSLDRAAFADPESWWPTVVEEMHYGFR